MRLLLPLTSGMVYVAGALFLKRAAELGANVWRTVLACNFTTALMFASLALLGGHIPSWQLCWQPALLALLFVAGQIASIMALKIGDVSVATPVLGLKVLLVALLTSLVIGQHLGAPLWAAALLSSGAIALLNVSGAHPHHRVGATICLSALAAGAYASLDVLVQKWAPLWGPGRLLPIMMALAAVLSLPLLSQSIAPEPRIDPGGETTVPEAGWVIAGAACFALQAIMFVSSIALYQHATVANVLYSSRGLWSVLAVWFIGHWFGNRERHLGPRVLAWRLIGTALLMAAILIVLLAPHHP